MMGHQSTLAERLTLEADTELAMERHLREVNQRDAEMAFRTISCIQQERPLARVVQTVGGPSPWRNLLTNRQALIVGALLGGFFVLGICCLIQAIASSAS